MSAAGEAKPSQGSKGPTPRDCGEADTPRPRHATGRKEAEG
jgi:hypothetical protein